MYQTVTGIENAPRIPIDQDAWALTRFPDLEIIRLHLEPGGVMASHRNDWRIVFFVLAGEGMLEVEGAGQGVREGETIAVKAGDLRSWKNTGTGALELLVIKTLEAP
jgi:quercetin dioxygenase-like cupin family protein